MQKKKKKILIDASHEEECRVAVISDSVLEEFEYESSSRRSIKGDVYLARVSRIEPSLQAAFVDFGGHRDGFLPFTEIHPDYYRIPVEDQKEFIQRLSRTHGSEETEDEKNLPSQPKTNPLKKYKIQEVIQKRQLLLVQIMRDGRGSKGAALTTYMSFPGRYCVLMPNTPKGGGISKKVTNTVVRKRLKELMSDLDVQEGSGLILRTAGVDCKKPEIKRDHEYLKKVWEDVKNLTISSQAPALVYQEGNLIKKTLRDIYSRDIEEILVEGEDAYRLARNFMGKLIPSHVKKIRLYKDQVPLFHSHDIELQIQDIYTPTAYLPSGGYLVFGTTEALTSIDVNSGKSTGERHIDETALKTNLEAADEIAKQLRLRDIGGLIVIDFIDMEQSKYKSQVEQRLENALKIDRARVQMGSISPFGLLEMSRQRLKPSLQESTNQACPMCQGTGNIPSLESFALQILRALENAAIKKTSDNITMWMPGKFALYLLNKKRDYIGAIEKTHGVTFNFKEDDDVGDNPWSFRLDTPTSTSPKQTRKKQDKKEWATSPTEEPNKMIETPTIDHQDTKMPESSTKTGPSNGAKSKKSPEKKGTSLKKNVEKTSTKTNDKDDISHEDDVKNTAEEDIVLATNPSTKSQWKTTQLKVVSSAQRFGHRKMAAKRAGLLRETTPSESSSESEAPSTAPKAAPPKRSIKKDVQKSKRVGQKKTVKKDAQKITQDAPNLPVKQDAESESPDSQDLEKRVWWRRFLER